MTRPGTIADADPVPVVLRCLRADTATLALLGGEPGRVGKENIPPYPRLRVTNPQGGSDRNLLRLVAAQVRVEALGDLDGRPGSDVLRRLLYTALAALARLPDVVPGPGEPAVTFVESTGAGGDVGTTGGQPRWLADVRLYLAAPASVPL